MAKTKQQTRAGALVWTTADRCKKAREAAGLDQEQLAALIDVSRASVSNYERGIGEPKRIVLKVWALACGVPLNYLLTGDLSEVDEGEDVPAAQASRTISWNSSLSHLPHSVAA